MQNNRCLEEFHFPASFSRFHLPWRWFFAWFWTLPTPCNCVMEDAPRTQKMPHMSLHRGNSTTIFPRWKTNPHQGTMKDPGSTPFPCCKLCKPVAYSWVKSMWAQPCKPVWLWLYSSRLVTPNGGGLVRESPPKWPKWPILIRISNKLPRMGRFFRWTNGMSKGENMLNWCFGERVLQDSDGKSLGMVENWSM